MRGQSGLRGRGAGAWKGKIVRGAKGVEGGEMGGKRRGRAGLVPSDRAGSMYSLSAGLLHFLH